MYEMGMRKAMYSAVVPSGFKQVIVLLATFSVMAFLTINTSPASAETIKSAMAAAYQSNPQLNAQRAATRAADEGVPLARSGLLPNITADADYGSTYTSSSLNGMVLS